MNAVSLNIPIPIAPGVLAQTAPLLASPGASGLGGFTALINLLLASAGPEPDSAPVGHIALAEDPSMTGAPLSAPCNATSDQIASALIRFMTKTKGVSASKKSPSDQEVAHTLAAAAGPSQNNFIPGGLNSVGSIVAAAVQSAALPLPLQVGSDGMSTLKSSVPESGVKGSDGNGRGGGSGVNAGVFLKTSEAAPNFKAPVTFEMHLTPVTEPKLADPQTTTQSGAAAAQQGALATQPAAPADSQGTVNPGSLAAQQSAAVTRPAHLAPSAGPSKPAEAAVLDAAPLRIFGQASTGAGENPGNNGGQAKPRQEQPAKAWGTVAIATRPESPAPGNAFSTGFLNAAPAQTGPSVGGPPESKNIPGPSTLLSAASLSEAATKDLNVPAQQQPRQTQQIEVRISQPQEPPVDLQIAQRAGQIQVVVRTPDAGLESSLRQDLNTLVHSLERSGFHTETFVPVAAAAAADSSPMSSQGDQSDSFRDGSSGQSGGGQGRGHGGGRDSDGDSHGHASRDRRQPEWTNSWEEQS